LKCGVTKVIKLDKGIKTEYKAMKVGFRELDVYKMAYGLAMDIFEVTRNLPISEKYSLVDQIRRSSRSICTNIGEGYRKRQYPAHFASKMSDADMENTETQIWLDFALSCNYLSPELHKKHMRTSKAIGKMLYSMIKNPHKFQDKRKP